MQIETTLTEAEAAAKIQEKAKADIFEILRHAPGEVRGVQQALREGKIDGDIYDGECACLVGTIANLRGRSIWKLEGITPFAFRPAERWFRDICPGHTPENNERARITDGWLTEWLEMYGEAQGNGG